MRPFILATVAFLASGPVRADDLYRPGNWAALSADRRAAQIGDLLTIVVYQAAEATAPNRSTSSRSPIAK